MKRRPARTSPKILRWTYALANGKQFLPLTITNLQTNQCDLCLCELSSNNPPTLAYWISQLTRYSRDYAANRQVSESKVPISWWLSWRHHFESYTVVTLTWLIVTEHLCHTWPHVPFVVITIRSFPLKCILPGSLQE
jgi:hypothetical protein